MADESEENVVIAATFAILHTITVQKRAKHKRLVWTKSWIQKRLTSGAYCGLPEELREHHSTGYRNFMRMDEDSFNLLLQMIRPLIQRQDTHMRTRKLFILL